MTLTNRYFLDSNVIISGLLWTASERKLLKLGDEGKLSLVTSAYVLMEVEGAFRDMGFDETRIAEALVYVRSFVALARVSREGIDKYWHALGHKKDVPVLAAAVASESILVTGDRRFAQAAARYLAVKKARKVLEDEQL